LCLLYCSSFCHLSRALRDKFRELMPRIMAHSIAVVHRYQLWICGLNEGRIQTKNQHSSGIQLEGLQPCCACLAEPEDCRRKRLTNISDRNNCYRPRQVQKSPTPILERPQTLISSSLLRASLRLQLAQSHNIINQRTGSFKRVQAKAKQTSASLP
jgi:hypothetical protein